MKILVGGGDPVYMVVRRSDWDGDPTIVGVFTTRPHRGDLRALAHNDLQAFAKEDFDWKAAKRFAGEHVVTYDVVDVVLNSSETFLSLGVEGLATTLETYDPTEAK